MPATAGPSRLAGAGGIVPAQAGTFVASRHRRGEDGAADAEQRPREIHAGQDDDCDVWSHVGQPQTETDEEENRQTDHPGLQVSSQEHARVGTGRRQAGRQHPGGRFRRHPKVILQEQRVEAADSRQSNHREEPHCQAGADEPAEAGTRFLIDLPDRTVRRVGTGRMQPLGRPRRAGRSCRTGERWGGVRASAAASSVKSADQGALVRCQVARRAWVAVATQAPPRSGARPRMSIWCAM